MSSNLINPVLALPDLHLGPDWAVHSTGAPTTVSSHAARTFAVTPVRGGPAALVRVHRVAHHPLSACYPYGAHDLVLGLALAEEGSRGRLLASRLLRAVVPALFAADPRCRRVVAAPDESDTVMQGVWEEGGFSRVTEADLGDASVVLFTVEPPDLAGMSTALDDMPH
ncbi:GNAT family N-acetyltransferase [Streptomyces spongiae]|uniref:Acetyltransferase n=1 Tax=Streptomyces spongiae TaxID=565072 RepID=A0A5N8X928_9ACTN|nr:GNAT family N-acetyltransferase [Streptomyces spongiae]MPY55949.1 acetyltransferase [Streptomyces spongiae]